MSVMTFAALFLPLAMPQAVDRSGEGLLRQLFAEAATIKTARMSIRTETRASASEEFRSGNFYELWFGGGGRFRLDSVANRSGSTFLIVSDGQTVLSDPLSDAAPITLLAGASTIFDSSEQLSARGSRSSPMFYLLAGPDAFEKLVANNGPIVASGSEVAFQSPDFGQVRFRFETIGARRLVREVEYDDLPNFRRAAASGGGMGGGSAPAADRLTRQTITYRSLDSKLPDWAFTTTPPPKRTVIDRRSGGPANRPRVMELVR